MGTIRLCSLLICALALNAQPSRDERWREDIDTLAAIIQQRHPEPTRSISREELTRAFDSLSAQVPSLADYQIVLGMNRVLALLRDGHTTLNPFVAAAGLRLFPIRLRYFTGGWYAIEAHTRHTAALGKRLLRIQGKPVEEVMRQVTTLIPHEINQWVLALAGNYLISPEVLHTLGIIAGRNSVVTYDFSGDISLPVQIEAGALFRYPRPGSPDPPLSQRNREYFYWYRWLEDQQTLYLKYDICQQDAALSMSALASEALALAAGKSVRLVLDLRDNAGGNSAVTSELLNAIGEAVIAGRVQIRDAYGIISRNTFSSGLLAAVELRNSGQVQLVGETAGQPPDHFGNVFAFILPHSLLSGQVSTREFRFPTLPGALTPDIALDYTIEDWAAQRDPYLETILRR